MVVSGSSVIYTPAADFSGVDTFTYTIEDNGTLDSNAIVGDSDGYRHAGQ